MHESTPNRDTPTRGEDQNSSSQHQAQQRPRALSQSDPEPDRTTRRTAIWLVIALVIVVSAFVVLHLTGVAGPGMH